MSTSQIKPTKVLLQTYNSEGSLPKIHLLLDSLKCESEVQHVVRQLEPSIATTTFHVSLPCITF